MASSLSSFRQLLKTYLLGINFQDISARHQRLFLAMFRGLAVLALTHVNPVIMMMMTMTEM